MLAFECANRDFFEQSVQARDPDYYSLTGVQHAIRCAQTDREKDLGYQYLVKLDDRLIGRVNFSAVVRPYFNKASIGYRLGQEFLGRGYATQAVGLALQEAFGALQLWRVEATVRTSNLGSIRVMERNGFVPYGLSRRSMLFHGSYHDLAHFERNAEAA